MTCPCGSGKLYTSCCGPFHSGETLPETPEKLMRSRYSAFAKMKKGYLAKTMRDPIGELDPNIHWERLEIIRAEGNIVEFIAHYRIGNQIGQMHEVSEFAKINEKWIYLQGNLSA
ncbi:MAG: hypothetical protein SP1CHLAM54_01870 [Chlamydiia bacterium]|nr:hypothetical protein [Chlamydiia bacterium]MCH9615105.1 hypothetical protein [Chlamydiia bacterium]MCH9628573.1 hypothetical protein [Chlamydiia bacterium]